ncbi:MAG: hypothetical protein JWP02_1736 [Acidimicrobiales bacterium]|nr:hypothetical protein [Acidimicrobiales bacterium]
MIGDLTGNAIAAAVAWSILTPTVLVVIGRLLGTQIGDSAWWLLAPSPVVMGFAGGRLLGGGKPWSYVLVLAAIAAAVFAMGAVLIGVAVAPTNCPPRPTIDCETQGYGIGGVLIFGVAFASLLPGLSGGMAVARRRSGPKRPF